MQPFQCVIRLAKVARAVISAKFRSAFTKLFNRQLFKQVNIPVFEQQSNIIGINLARIFKTLIGTSGHFDFRLDVLMEKYSIF